MKYIIHFLVCSTIITLTSCGGSSETNNQKFRLSISIDSALVDAKGEIIDTKYGLNSFDFDKEKDFMYKFNTNNRHGLEIIDMNKMELVDFIPFQVEGPNGTSSWVSSVQFIADDEIIITNNENILKFNLNAELQKKYRIPSINFEGDSIPNDMSMEYNGLFVPSENISFNLVNQGHGYLRGFAKLSFQDSVRKTFFIDEINKLDEYYINLPINGRIIMLRTYLYSAFHDNKFILSHDMENELYFYDLKSDSLIHKQYESLFSANKNEIYGKKETESREEVGQIMSDRNKSIRFKDIIYDDKNKQYYRFSSFSTTPDQEVDNWNIILTIFDENLNQIHEISNIELEEVPETYFVKDGKIYVYKNMEDEMGFMILTID